MIKRKKENHHIVKVLPIHIQEQLLEKSSKKYRVLFILMLDSGLRISETISLKVDNFDFFHKHVTVKSLKKRGKQLYRDYSTYSQKYKVSSRLLGDIKKQEG